MSEESAGSRDSRVTRWAAESGQIGSASDFAARLNGPQVGAEILQIFRETPEFGRSLAMRLEPFLDESCSGKLTLIGGGGEATVFYDDPAQEVIKLLAPPGKAAFGWVIDSASDQKPWRLRAGSLTEALVRFAWFEQCFESGLDLDWVGSKGDFLVLKQPFILGRHPDEGSLHQWMQTRGWVRHSPISDLAMLRDLTWIRGEDIATDVRPENALIAEVDNRIYAIDFIMGKLSPPAIC